MFASTRGTSGATCKIEIDLDHPDVSAVLRPVWAWPITAGIASQSVGLDFRGDPADGLIAATSVVYGVPLLTRGRRIRRSGLVPFAR